MIEVTGYNPSWPFRFEALARHYAEAMTAAGVPVLAIVHVGSTSVPGLAAKPVIDCDIVVEREWVERASDVLVSLGFAAEGELGIPERWAFQEPSDYPRTNTYVVVAGSLALKNHLAVRDTLRNDETLREEYGRAKKQSAEAAHSMAAYIAGKNDVVQRILAAGGVTEAERAEINAMQDPARR